MQAIIQFIAKRPKDDSQLVPCILTKCIAIHVAAGKINDTGIVLVLLHVVADPLQYLRPTPTMGHLSIPGGFACREVAAEGEE